MKLEKYKRAAFWPMSTLSLLFLFVFCASNFRLPISESNPALFNQLDNLIWAVFALDYCIMLMLSDSRKSFIRSHFLDLIVVALPFLRVLRIGLLVLMLVKMLGQLKNRILISVPVYALVTSILFVTLGAASVYDAEYQAEGSNIRSIEDSFWWAAVTIFTVGYGDRFPVTTEGRIYGVALMACGIAIVGTITATLAGWLISQIKEVESENKKLLDSLNRIEEKLQKF